MTKYQEYKAKAAKLDKLMACFADNITTDTVAINGKRLRVNRDHLANPRTDKATWTIDFLDA